MSSELSKLLKLIAQQVVNDNPYQPGTEAESAYLIGVEALREEVEKLFNLLVKLSRPSSTPGQSGQSGQIDLISRDGTYWV